MDENIEKLTATVAKIRRDQAAINDELRRNQATINEQLSLLLQHFSIKTSAQRLAESQAGWLALDIPQLAPQEPLDLHAHMPMEHVTADAETLSLWEGMRTPTLQQAPEPEPEPEHEQ